MPTPRVLVIFHRRAFCSVFYLLPPLTHAGVHPTLICPSPHALPAPSPPRDALEGKGPQRRPQKRLGRRLEEVAKAVGGGYCRLRMPLKWHLPLGRQWLGIGWAPWRGRAGGNLPTEPDGMSHRGFLPPFQCIPAPRPGTHAAMRVP